MVKPTGDVITQKTKEVIAKGTFCSLGKFLLILTLDMIFPIGDIKLDESDFIALKRGGTGFASGKGLTDLNFASFITFKPTTI